MSNASLTAKHRPQTFADVAGQDTLKAILSRASLEDKVAPAYLFSGTRGVGKTTLARIFAKALNCRHAPTAEPCNSCDQCHAVTMGNAVDVIEIDGASNRGIDDVRRLKEVVGYAPMEGRYKIFIIDEAHMLSREAFNALLKTLEEPPANVTFIMATTEPHKFPATIISRCQHYVFKRLSDNGLLVHLAKVLQKEHIAFEESALQLIARRGAGSVRDSMSLLGQVLALGTGEITEEVTRGVLGLAGQEALFSMAESITDGDTLTVAHTIGDLMDQGLDIGFFLRELTALWRNLFILRQSGEAGKTAIDAPESQKNLLFALSSRFSLSHIHACWQMTIEGQRRVLTSMEPGLALELLLMNLAMLPQLLSLDGLSAMARRSMPPMPQSSPPAAGGSRGSNATIQSPQQAQRTAPLQRNEVSSTSEKSPPQSSSPSGDALGQSLPSPLSANTTTVAQEQEVKAEREEQKNSVSAQHSEQVQHNHRLPSVAQENRRDAEKESNSSFIRKESALPAPKEEVYLNVQNEGVAAVALEEDSSRTVNPSLAVDTKNHALSEKRESNSFYENVGKNDYSDRQEPQPSLTFMHEEDSGTTLRESEHLEDHNSKRLEEEHIPVEQPQKTLPLSDISSRQHSSHVYADWSVIVDWCAEHEAPPWFMPLMKNVTGTWDAETLLLQPKDAFTGQRLMAPSAREFLDPALAEVCGFLPHIDLLQPLKKAEDHAVIKEKVQSHPHVKTLEETFDARLVDFGQIY